MIGFKGSKNLYSKLKDLRENTSPELKIQIDNALAIGKLTEDSFGGRFNLFAYQLSVSNLYFMKKKGKIKLPLRKIDQITLQNLGVDLKDLVRSKSRVDGHDTQESVCPIMRVGISKSGQNEEAAFLITTSLIHSSC